MSRPPKANKLETLNSNVLQLAEELIQEIKLIDNLEGKTRAIKALATITSSLTENTVKLERLKLEQKQVENSNNNLLEKLRQLAKQQ